MPWRQMGFSCEDNCKIVLTGRNLTAQLGRDDWLTIASKVSQATFFLYYESRLGNQWENEPTKRLLHRTTDSSTAHQAEFCQNRYIVNELYVIKKIMEWYTEFGKKLCQEICQDSRVWLYTHWLYSCYYWCIWL